MKEKVKQLRAKIYQRLANFIYSQLKAALDIEKMSGKSFGAFDMWLSLGYRLDFIAKEHDIYLD